MTQIIADWLTTRASQAVCGMLTNAGFQAWFVGGCVRNALIGAPVADLDLSTNARPEKVMELAKGAGLKVIPTGIDHGTVTVIADGDPYEVTTFRRDVETDGRRAVVAFADTMTEDARRRDFTMNALYVGPDGTVADPLGGLPDLDKRLVRFIDDADMRIKEDYLRILRFFRFHAWYGDTDAGIDADGLAACAENIEGLQTLSGERVGQEMLKLLAAPDPAPSLAAMASTGALAQILPGADHGMLAPLVHLESSLDLQPDPLRRLALLGGMGTAEVLRLSKAQARTLAIYAEFGSAPKASYLHGAHIGRGVLALLATLQNREIDAADLALVDFAQGQTLPVTAADLMPQFQGEALGQKLRETEAQWIASGFTLTKDALLG